MAIERTTGGSPTRDTRTQASMTMPLSRTDLITVEARVVVASIDTYLKYSESMAQLAPVSRPAAVVSQEAVLAENAALRAQLAATPSGATRSRRARRRRTPQPA